MRSFIVRTAPATEETIAFPMYDLFASKAFYSCYLVCVGSAVLPESITNVVSAL